MSIDICTTIYRNYSLLDLQLSHWKTIKGDHRLLAVDNTPRPERIKQSYPVIELDVSGIDGETHGAALDLLVRTATSDIVGIVDSDFFWLNKNILKEVEKYFEQGYKCVGCAGFYPDWQRNLDPRHPDRAGHLAPVCWGMFVDRKLAMEQTFVVSAQEGPQVMETGWRLRKRIIDEKIPCVVFQGFYPENWNDPECCFFGTPEKYEGVHLLKGSAARTSFTGRLQNIIDTFGGST